MLKDYLIELKIYKVMKLIATCADVNLERWHELMKYTRPCSGRILRNRIKKELPELYEALCLDFYNPYESHARKSTLTGI